MRLAPHAWGSGVLFAASLHIAMAAPNCHILEVTQGYMPMMWDLFNEPFDIRPDGMVHAPDRADTRPPMPSSAAHHSRPPGTKTATLAAAGVNHPRRGVCLTRVGPVGALILQTPAANAIPMTFVGNLSGANEVPPVNSPGTGLATVILDPTAQTLQVNATFSGLTSNDTMAHIHCCAPLGTNAGVATITLWTVATYLKVR